MANMVDLGFFRRAGVHTEGIIGPIRVLFDRHHGGVATLASRETSVGPVRVAARVRVIKGGQPILLRQEADPDPRLIIAEQGPVRIWMRVMFSLLDEGGNYHGDGLTETIVYNDGEVRLAFCVRLVDASMHDTVTDAWIEMDCGGDVTGGRVGAKRQAELPRTKTSTYSFRRQLPGRFVALDGVTGGLAVGYYSLDGRSEDKLGGVGTWHGPADRAPWYDTWGHLYDQWHGLSGWGGHKTGRLAIEPRSEGGGPTVTEPGATGGLSAGAALAGRAAKPPVAHNKSGCTSVQANWHWLAGVNEPCGANFGCRAMLGLYFDADAKAAVKRLQLSFEPVLPQITKGNPFEAPARFCCLDVVENVLLFKGRSGNVDFLFKSDPARRVVRLRLVGQDADTGSFTLVNDKPVTAQRLLTGGMTDDPYGTNLARPGDRFVPLIGDVNNRESEVVVSAVLARKAKTELKNWPAPHSVFYYLKWDDRQLYVMREFGDAQPRALFSTQTLCVHDLRLRDKSDRQFQSPDHPAVVRIPLYWYPTNVQTRGHCTNQLRRLTMGVLHDFQTRIEVVSEDPGARLRSEVELSFPSFHDTALQADVSCRLEVLRQYDLPEIQFLNLFPYNSWRTEDWETDWVVTLDDAGQETTYFVKEPRGKSVVGDQATHWPGRLFLAYGARDRGNILVLADRPSTTAHLGAEICGTAASAVDRPALGPISPAEGGRITAEGGCATSNVRCSARVVTGRKPRPADLGKPRYALCRVWLDSHFSLDGLKAPVKAGTKLAMDYTVAIWGDKRLSRAEALEIGRKAIRSGRLELP